MDLFDFRNDAAAFQKALEEMMKNPQAISFQNEFEKMIKEHQEKEAMFLTMPTEELSQLPDDELFSAVLARTDHIIFSHKDMIEGVSALNEEQRIFHAVSYLEMEVENGGICQFFINSSRLIVPVVSEYMGKIGAIEHKKLYDNFIEKYNIDVADLSSFNCESVEDFSVQYKRYPFDEYDDAFGALEPLQNHLIPFIRANLDKF